MKSSEHRTMALYTSPQSFRQFNSLVAIRIIFSVNVTEVVLLEKSLKNKRPGYAENS